MRKESITNAGKYETLTQCPVFRSYSQDSRAVLSVMFDVLKDLMGVMPHLQRVYYWQDSAGCYHCGNTISIAHMVGKPHGVTVKYMDFCDPQGGTWVGEGGGAVRQKVCSYKIPHEDLPEFWKQH